MFSTARAASTAYLEFNHYSMQFIGIIIIHYSELVITFALQVMCMIITQKQVLKPSTSMSLEMFWVIFHRLLNSVRKSDVSC